MPWIDETLTTAPLPCFIRCGRLALIAMKTDRRLICMAASQRSTVVSSSRARMLTPATFTNASNLPYVATAVATSLLIEASLLTSVSTKVLRPPAARMYAATCSPVSTSRSAMVTAQPCSLSTSAVALPMPFAPPVTMAALPCMRP